MILLNASTCLLIFCQLIYFVSCDNNTLEIDNNSKCNISAKIKDEIKSYANPVNKIIQYFINGDFKGKTYKSLEDFVDMFGNRLVGTQNLENAIDYIVNLLKMNSLENVHTQDVQVPRWTRGSESAVMLKPRYKKLPMLGLGLSVGTPGRGIIAPAIVVKSFDELNALSFDEVNGTIVVYDEPFESYGKTVKYRSLGASEAAKKGAVAALVRSITPFSIATPHTGMMFYQENVPKIPIAAITHEDADLLWRLQEKKQQIIIKFKMSAHLDTSVSRNTIAELQGSKFNNNVVILSGHIDSWDVGDGAMDDGGGSFISLMGLSALKNLGLRAKRTIRTILWTGEEVGLVGSQAYIKYHTSLNETLNFVLESDMGTFNPLGISYAGNHEGKCIVQEVLKLFTAINTTQVVDGESGPDIQEWTDNGIPGGGLLNENENYFWYHHSEGDRINVLSPNSLDKAAALWAAFSYVIADLENDMPRNSKK